MSDKPDNTTKEGRLAIMDNAIQDALRASDPDGEVLIATRWALVADLQYADGTSAVRAVWPMGTKEWEGRGLLHYALEAPDAEG